MITKEQERTVVTNVNNSSNFKIQNNAKMFSILSSGIYADPIRAIIRELSCNAIDSHIDAGKKDTPFYVRLPSRFDPKLQIEDFGIGLDHEGVTEVYTTYGMSTKTDSNDVIGALGLGSKTPFSYAETFTIRARKDGMERWYNAYIGNEGFPTISRLSERPTDECNGMMIEVAVKDSDCGRFREKAQQVFKTFKNVPDGLPEGMGDSIRAKSEEMYDAFEKDGFYLDRSADRGIYAVMGNIAYRIPDNLIEAAREGMDQYLKSRFGASYCIFLPFDIGELDIAANRETLSFSETDDDPTYMAILAKLDNTLGVYLEKVQEYLDACPTWIEACQYIRHEHLQMVAGMFTYQGVPMDKVRTSQIRLDRLFHHRTVWSSTAFNQFTRVKYETRVYDTDGRSTSDPNIRNRDIASCSGMVVLYNDREDSRGVPTAIRWFVSNYGSGKYVIGTKDAISKDVMKRVKERVPCVEFVPISPVIAERKERMARERPANSGPGKYEKPTEVKARTFDGERNYNVKILDIEQLRDLGHRVVYYRPSDARVTNEWEILGKTIDIDDWSRMVLNFFGIDTVIYANKGNMKRIEDNGIPNIEDKIKERIPLMKRLAESKERIRQSMDLDDYLLKVRSNARLPGTTRQMDEFITKKLHEKGHISYSGRQDTSNDHRLLKLIGARYFAGHILRGCSLERRMERGEHALKLQFFTGSSVLKELVGKGHHKNHQQTIDEMVRKDSTLVDRFIKDNPVVCHLNPQFEYGGQQDHVGSEEFIKIVDDLVDNWTPTSV